MKKFAEPIMRKVIALQKDGYNLKQIAAKLNAESEYTYYSTELSTKVKAYRATAAAYRAKYQARKAKLAAAEVTGAIVQTPSDETTSTSTNSELLKEIMASNISAGSKIALYNTLVG